MVAPLASSDEETLAFIRKNVDWLNEMKQQYVEQEKQAALRYADGQTHYFEGKAYFLKLRPTQADPHIDIDGNTMYMYVTPNMSAKKRERLLEDFYFEYLKEAWRKIYNQWKTLLDEDIEKVIILAYALFSGTSS